jgi:hypothetical protein
MRALVFLLIFAFSAAFTFAQKSKPDAHLLYYDNEGVEILPEFRGGDKAFTKYVQKNLRWSAGENMKGELL